MARVITALSTSLDGYITGANDTVEQPLGDNGAPLHDWYTAGDVPSSVVSGFRLSPPSAAVFDEVAGGLGAIVSGRRTYDVSGAWGGGGPLAGVPLFVLTHEAPDEVPAGEPPYTFVQDGIESAIAQASAAANGKDVALMGADVVQQALKARLLDILEIDLVPIVLGDGVSLLDNLGDELPQFELDRVVDAPGVTHLTYRVVKKTPSASAGG